MTPKARLFGLPVSSDLTISNITERVLHATRNNLTVLYASINPQAFAVARNDPDYVDSLSEIDHILCDGIGVVLAARLTGIGDIHRLTFDSTSLAPHIFSLCAAHGLEMYFIGGRKGVAQAAVQTVRSRYSSIRIVGYHSGFFEDDLEPIEAILDSSADIVVCGMGVPKQEKFLLALKHAGWTGVGFGCGGYLDQLSNGFDYYPKWIDRFDLRFLYRLYREPTRLWRRYLVEYAPFLGLLIRHIWDDVIRHNS